MNETMLARWLPAVMIALLLAVGFASLDQVNATWDEALGDYFFGERYLSFFTSFDRAYLDFEANPYPPGRSPDLGLSPFKGRPWEYYPVANTLAAATSEVLSRRLGWLDPFDGFHAVNMLFGAWLIAVFFPFLRRRLGLMEATLALGLLFTAPRVFCHLLANIKDFPLMALYTLTLVAFYRAWERGSARGLLGAGVLWGLTLATKANALFLPGIPLLVVAFAQRPEAWKNRSRTLWAALTGAATLASATMVAVWPYLWGNPIGRYFEHLKYIGFRADHMRPESFAPALQAVLLTTPPLFLLLLVPGFLLCLVRARRRDPMAWLALTWVGVVSGRFLLPGAVNFDGVRHFLELFPAFAMIAAIGGAAIVRGITRRTSRPRIAQAALLTLLLLPGTWATWRAHPFQIAYWNAFTGGYDGARERGLPQASDYWGVSYRLGMRWLNENAPQGALLAVPVVEHAVRLVAPVRLRSDLVLLPITTPFSPRIHPERLQKTYEAAQTRPLYVMFVDRRDWRNALIEDCLERLKPEVTWDLEGEPVLAIYRWHSGQT